MAGMQGAVVLAEDALLLHMQNTHTLVKLSATVVYTNQSTCADLLAIAYAAICLFTKWNVEGWGSRLETLVFYLWTYKYKTTYLTTRETEHTHRDNLIIYYVKIK